MKSGYLIIGLIVISGLLIGITEARSGNGIVVEDITIEANGRVLSALHSYPEGTTDTSDLPGVAVFHGFTASKEMMRPFTEGIARKGFVVITVDQQGHGLSSGNLREDGNTSLRDDGVEVVNYLRSLPGVDPGRIGLLGHSMGAGTAISTSAFLGDIQSTVLLGNSLGNVDQYNANSSFPANLFMGIGEYDELFTVDDALQSFDTLVDETAEINTLYGSFSDGTARELLVTGTDHLLEIINPGLVERSIQWLLLSMVDSTLQESDPLLQVNGFQFVLDQILSYLAGFFLLLLIPATFMILRGNTEEDGDFRPLGHGLSMFLAFMVGLPFGVIFGFQFIFLVWYALGFVLFARRSKDIRSAFIPSREWLIAHIILFAFIGLVQVLLMFFTWDFRYVIPFLGALNLRRLLLFLTLYIPGTIFFTMEITAMRGQESSPRTFVVEALCRIWPFVIFLLIHYVPIIVFQVTLLPGIVGFLAFFVVGFLPVMVVISLLTMLMRSSRISAFAQAVIVSGLINWMLAMTLSFNA